MNKTRIENLAKQLKIANLSAMMICPSEDLFFFADFSPKMCKRFQALFITDKGDTFYISNMLYKGEVEKSLNPSVKIYTWKDGESMTDAVKLAFNENGITPGMTIGVNAASQAFNVLDIEEACVIKCINGLPAIEEARIIKTTQEIADLRKSAQITDAAFATVLGFIKPGMKEADIMEFLANHMIKAGGTHPWGIIASGENSAYPHYHAYDRVIQEKDMMILDFGCRYNGLYSDMSRTVFVGGISDEDR